MDTDHAAVLREHAGQGFGPFKTALTELVVTKLAPIASETSRLLSDKAALVGLLRVGAERAAAIADPIVNEAERLVGFVGLARA
jgi:tryptophanyl-tRNA synthetase